MVSVFLSFLFDPDSSLDSFRHCSVRHRAETTCSSSLTVRLSGLLASVYIAYRFDCATIVSRMSSEKNFCKYLSGDMMSSGCESVSCLSGYAGKVKLQRVLAVKHPPVYF